MVACSYHLFVRAHLLSSLAVAAVCALSVAGCSDSPDLEGGSDEPVTVTIDEADGEIDASDDVVEASRGQEITFVVSSDAADEIHVHSDPEQEFAVEAADDQEFTFSIDAAGQYAVESHELDLTILKLQID